MSVLLRYLGRVLLLAVPAASLLMVSGCTGRSCNDAAALGVVVFVADRVTGQDVCSATVTVTDGAYAETLQMRSGGDGHTCEYVGATERPGTYTVSVTAAGYQPAQEDNAVAQAGTCHVQTATVTTTLAH